VSVRLWPELARVRLRIPNPRVSFARIVARLPLSGILREVTTGVTEGEDRVCEFAARRSFFRT